MVMGFIPGMRTMLGDLAVAFAPDSFKKAIEVVPILLFE
jgi:hypothetical protein